MEIKGSAKWLVFENPETGRLVAFCDELCLNAGGDSYDDLAEAVHEVSRSKFKMLYDEGLLDDFVQEHGLTMPDPTDSPDDPTFGLTLEHLFFKYVPQQGEEKAADEVSTAIASMPLAAAIA